MAPYDQPTAAAAARGRDTNPPDGEPPLLDDLDKRLLGRISALTGGQSPSATAQAWQDWAYHLAIAPGRRIELYGQALKAAAALARSWAREGGRPWAFEPLPADRRFRSQAWERFPFNILAQTQLAMEAQWRAATHDLRGVNPHYLQRVEFLGQLALGALAPVNFAATNPEVIDAAVESGGRNFVEGWRLYLQDVARLANGGRLTGLDAFTVGETMAVFDPSVVRGLEYYTGAVFEAELLLQTLNERGETVRFGSVGGGGRYDDLVARFTGERTPATGFSFGVSRLSAALNASGSAAAAQGARGPVVVIAFDSARMNEYFALAGELRAAGIAAEVYLGTSGMRAQMKYADRRLAPAAVILGDDEIAAGTVTIKDLDLGRALSSGVTDNTAWRADRPGQINAPRANWVAAVQDIVGRSR